MGSESERSASERSARYKDGRGRGDRGRMAALRAADLLCDEEAFSQPPRETEDGDKRVTPPRPTGRTFPNWIPAASRPSCPPRGEPKAGLEGPRAGGSSASRHLRRRRVEKAVTRRTMAARHTHRHTHRPQGSHCGALAVRRENALSAERRRD